MHLGERYYSNAELASFEFASLGRNVLIKRNAAIYFTENVTIGDNSRIDDFTVIVASSKPVCIGRNVHIASHCYVSGSDGFIAEDFCGLAPGVLVFTSSDDYSGSKLTNPTLPRHLTGGKKGAVHLERHVIVGAGTVIMPDVTIGLGSSVGAQSLVNKSLPKWGIFAGVPAQFLRPRSQDLLRLEATLLNGNGVESDG